MRVGSCEFFSQGMLVALGTGTGRSLLEVDSKLSLEHSELYVFLICVEKHSCYSQSLFNFRIISALRGGIGKFPDCYCCNCLGERK
jgi:hypothetical protein